MANTKKTKLTHLQKKIVFIYLVLFPFGQLLRFETSLFGKQFTFHLIDIVVGLSIPLFIFGFLEIHAIYKNISAFLLVAVFSLFLSLGFMNIPNVLIGLFYLIRFFAYSTFFLLVWNLVLRDVSFKKTLFNALILVTVFIGLFGWLQYFFMADLTALKILGWDDHMHRLVGTFLDPGFTSIILVLGFMVTLVKFLKNRQKRFLPILVFLLISIAFTYARAAYLALFVGIFSLTLFKLRKYPVVSATRMKRSSEQTCPDLIRNTLWSLPQGSLLEVKSKKERFKVKQPGGLNSFEPFGWARAVLMSLGFLGLIILLPRPYGEGVKLERTYSIYAKYENYIETFEIIKKQPVFGVGFNNMCFARMRYLENADSISHACSGSDSSLLFVLATTGIVGLIVFINMSLGIFKSVRTSVYGKAFLSCSLTLFVHSLFVHSLFYPWVMGWMGILLALSIRNELKVKN